MIRYAHMNGNTVVNVSQWDGVADWTPEGEVVELPADSPVCPGYTRTGDVWNPPPYPPFTPAV